MSKVVKKVRYAIEVEASDDFQKLVKIVLQNMYDGDPKKARKLFSGSNVKSIKFLGELEEHRLKR